MADRRRTVTSPSFDPGDIGGGSDDGSGGGGGGSDDDGGSTGPSRQGRDDRGSPPPDPEATPDGGGGDDDSSSSSASTGPSRQGRDDRGSPPPEPDPTPDPDPRNAPSATGGAGRDDGGRDAGDPADAPSATPDPGAAEQGVETGGAVDRVVDAAAGLEQTVVDRFPSLDGSDVRVERAGDRLEAELTDTGRAALIEERTDGRDPDNPADAPSASGQLPSRDGRPFTVPAPDDRGGSGPPASDVGGPGGVTPTPDSPAQPPDLGAEDTTSAPSPAPTTPGGPGETTPGQDAADAVFGAERDPEVVDELTTGGLLSERGESGGLLPGELSANTPEGTATVDVSETRAREFARGLSRVGESGDAGAFANSQALLVAPFTGGQGVQPTRRDVDPTVDGRDETLVENAFEGAGQLPFDAPAGVLQAETAAEVAQSAPATVGEEGAGTVAETGVAVGRDAATRTAQEARESPGEFAGAVGAGLLLGGAGAASSGTAASGLRAGIRAELDPRVGPLGTTAETQAIRGLRDRFGSDDDTGGLTPDGDLGSGGSGQILDADTVDAGRGVSDPSIATRLRGDAERQVSEVRDTIAAFNERVRERTSGTDRGQLQLGDQRPDSGDDGGGSPSSFDSFDGARRDDILAGSPRDRISDDIADRTQAQRRQFSGDVEQPFDERGGGTRTPADRATFDPDADQDTGPVAEAVARRQDAEQRFDRRGDGRRDGDATAARLGLGAIGAGGLAGGLFGGDADQGLGLRDRPRFDVGGRPDVDATPDSDVFTDFDFGQDIGADTPQDTPTDITTDTPTTDLGDPDLRDPPTRDPRDPPTRDPGDPTGDPPPRDPDPPLDPDSDEGSEDEFTLFGTRSEDGLVDSGILSGSEAATNLFR